MFHFLLLLGVFSVGVCLPRQYYFINESKTWSEAQKYCRENYTDLVTISNTEEELAVADITYVVNSRRTWIGLYDDLNSWKWSLDTDSFFKNGERNFRNWYKEIPSYWNGFHSCAYLSLYDGVWRAIPCYATLPFICFDGRVNASEKYVPVNQHMNWTEAQKHCRENYTDLASVRNEAENQKIRFILSDVYYYYYGFWIGLYSAGSWSDKSNSSFSNWKPGQPDNYRQNETCIAVSFNDSGKWTDENCSQTFPFLCYKTLSLSSYQYHFVNENKTWVEAQRYCRENYIDLATINNMEDMNNILNTTNSYSGSAWIGLHGDMNNWRWSLDNDALYQEGEKDFRGWNHQPDNFGGNELCVYIYTDGTWFDGHCRMFLPFVCYDEKNGTYTWINQAKSWAKARDYCREHYTDLASVRNQTDNEGILNLTDLSPSWIGLYRARIWSDKQETTYEHWREYSFEQPDNGLNSVFEYNNQHCTAVSFRYSGHWTDENCFSSFPFVCYNKSCTGSSCDLPQYHFINENKTWTEAQKYCREKYTDLATINNMEEMNTLLNKANGIDTDLAWIGLYDDLNSWKWSLGDDSFYKNGERNFRNWYIYKPWTWNGNNLCGTLDVYGAYWNVYIPCSSIHLFICFDGNLNASESYVIVYKRMNWTEAQRYCREHYTDLASVRNETENQMIRLSLTNNINNNMFYDNYYYYYYYYYYDFYYYYTNFWIGLYTNSSWSDGSNSSFSNWKLGQPNDFGQNKSCAAVSFNNYYDYGNWMSENCGEAFPFLCYSAMSSTSSHQYHFINENATWTEAQRYCREKYKDLATINNMEEMNTLINTVNGSYSGLAWIGLYDDLDSWRWSLDDKNVYQDRERDFIGWPHQPDNYNGNEMCVSMSYRGTWYDSSCTERKSFICYNGINNTYVFINYAKTWGEAQTFCRMNYTDLASVRNETELQQILNITNGYDVWIGLYRNRLWSDQSNSTFTYWRPQSPETTPEPDNGVYSHLQRGSQHCTAVDSSGQWTDENCFNRFPFICYTAFTPGAVFGLHMKVTANKYLLKSQIKGQLLIQLQQELSKLGLSSNFTAYVRNIDEIGP